MRSSCSPREPGWEGMWNSTLKNVEFHDAQAGRIGYHARGGGRSGPSDSSVHRMIPIQDTGERLNLFGPI